MTNDENNRIEAEIQKQMAIAKEAKEVGFSEVALGAISEAAIAADFNGARAAELGQLAAELIERSLETGKINPNNLNYNPALKLRPAPWVSEDKEWCPIEWLPDYPLPPEVDKISRHLSWFLRRGAVEKGFGMRSDCQEPLGDVLELFGSCKTR